MRRPLRILRDLPKLDTIGPNTPLRLDVAATLAYPDGSMTASGLRRERDKGRLVIERTAGKDYTVPRNETPMAHSANERSGSFETDRAKLARAALHKIALAPNCRSANTLPTSINPIVHAAAIPPKS